MDFPFSCILAGLSFRPMDAKVAANEITPGQKLSLEREPDNKYDENAIKVILNSIHTGETDCHIGYVPKDVAAELAPLMDAGQEFVCETGIRLSTHKFELLIDEISF